MQFSIVSGGAVAADDPHLKVGHWRGSRLDHARENRRLKRKRNQKEKKMEGVRTGRITKR